MTRLRSERGQALAEFTLVVPLLITMLFAIFHFGAALNVLQGLNTAAREGARVGAVGGDACAVAGGVLDDVPGSNEACAVVATCPGDAARVQATADYRIQIPLVGTWDLSLTGTGEFRCES